MIWKAWRPRLRFRPGGDLVWFSMGPVDVTFGSSRRLRWGRWWPDGLHVWVGRIGVHAYWASSPYMRRVKLDRVRDEDLAFLDDLDPDVSLRWDA